jgi:signal transduction histidine kinase
MDLPLPALRQPDVRPSFRPLRVFLLIAACGLGLGMLIGKAQQAPLALEGILEVLVGWSFAACGIFIWARRPANRLGVLMTTVGMLWLIGRTLTLVPDALVYPIGLWCTDLWAPAFALFLLSFPTGRMTSRVDLGIVGIFLFVTVPLEIIWFLFLVPANGLNALAVLPDADAAHVIDTIQRDLISLGAVLLVLALGRHWLRSSGPVRRQMWPVLVGGLAILLQSVSWISSRPARSMQSWTTSSRSPRSAFPLRSSSRSSRPRSPAAQSRTSSWSLDRHRRRPAFATPSPMRSAIPCCESPTGRPARLDSSMRPDDPVDLPSDDSGQAVTILERDGVQEAAIIHDAILLDEPGIVASVASAMRLAVENERLTAAVEEQLTEVRASRARIVAAGDAERQRIERDLHDGAQQRLVALTLALRLARSRLGDDGDPAIKLSLEQASEEARAALGELRELARGIHPQVLTASGLHTAIESLVGRTPGTVSVEIDPDVRFPPAVEAIAYFVVSESLANIAKHAEASSVQVRAEWRGGMLVIEISDDGRGGADPQMGTGLRGLMDRLSAVDGTLEVLSPAEGGTRIVARIPTVAPTNVADPMRARAEA